MMRSRRIQYFESEGRENLPSVIKYVKNYLKTFRLPTGDLLPGRPNKIVCMTFRGEGPMLAYHQLFKEDVTIVAVLFPSTYRVVSKDSITYSELPDKVRKFFDGVGIRVIRTRLPFDEITGADAHNKEMTALKRTLAVFGGSVPLAIQAVLQATDSGEVMSGEQVIAFTSDTALVVTASTTKDFLSQSSGLLVNEILCKPKKFTIIRPTPKLIEALPNLTAPKPALVIEGRKPGDS